MSKIGFNDAFDTDFSNKIVQLAKDMEGLLAVFKKLGQDARALNKAIKGAKSFQELTDNTRKAAEANNRFSASEKKIIRNIQATRLAATEEGKAIALSAERKRRATAANREWAKSQLGAEKATHRLWKAVALGNVVANVFTRIIRGIGRALKDTVKKIADFDQAIANVGAIANASKEEMERLSRTALKLGGSTKFTSTQVAELQFELAKLGYTVSEIVAAQAAILELAAAAQSELPRAAEIAGITVNQFGLQAEDTQRVVDVMSKSFKTSALDLEKFAEAMKYVGPAAKASGISIERTTAMIGQLADAGISGSMAGTSLRQIMLVLSKEAGGTFSEKLKKATDRTVSLGDANEEVKQRAATALLVLKDGADTVDAYTKALEDSAGAAKELAERQLDTLKGKVVALSSAWDRLIISVTNSETGFRGIKGIIQGFSDIMNNWVDSEIALTTAVEKEALAFKDSFIAQIADRDYSGKMRALTEEIRFIQKEINNYSQELSEANYQLKNTKKREKEAREEWEQRKGVAEGMLRIYEQYIVLLRDVNLEDKKGDEETTEKVTGYNALKKELDDLVEKRNSASLSEVENINKEIEAVNKKIKVYKDLFDQVGEYDQLFEGLGNEALEFLTGTFEEEVQDIPENFLKGWQEAWKAIEESGEGAIENLEEILAIQDEERLKRMQDQQAAEEAMIIETRDLKMASINAAFDLGSALTRRRVAQLEQEAEAGIISEKKLATEKKKLAKRQAAIDKAQGLFNIAVNTAIAVTKVMPNPVLIALVLALGALSAAAVLAEPIPAYAKGVESAPGGPALVSEKGQELVRERSGKTYLTPKKPSLMNIPKGASVTPADITNEMLKYSAVASAMPEAKDSEILMMMGELKGIKSAIKDKPVSSSTLTPAGILTATHRGNTTIKKMDKFFK